jgi:hypothetical protein
MSPALLLHAAHLSQLQGESMNQPTQSVTAYKSVAEAALDLGHKTYSGTVAATLRHTEADETRR